MNRPRWANVREKLRAISRNSIRETFRGPAGRSDPFELLVLGPPVLRNGLRIIAETTHRRSPVPHRPPKKTPGPLSR